MAEMDALPHPPTPYASIYGKRLLISYEIEREKEYEKEKEKDLLIIDMAKIILILFLKITPGEFFNSP